MAEGGKWTVVSRSLLIKLGLAASALFPCSGNAGDNVRVGVELNAEKGFRLESLAVEDLRFPSGGGFPTFLLFNKEGAERRVSADSSFFTEIRQEKDQNGQRILYKGDGFSISVTYHTGADGGLLIRIKPQSEEKWKIRAVTDGGALASIPSDGADAPQTGFLLRPYRGGELIRFPADKEVLTDSQPQNWEYEASFVALGWKSHGLIIRAPGFGAVWAAGTGNIRGVYSLHAGLTVDFRPRRDLPGPYAFWSLPLVESEIDIQVLPVGDSNRDGIFNWADCGVSYREHFIRRNRHLDPQLPGAVIGKIDLSLPYQGTQTYDQLIKEIQAIHFAPQIWWLVGAHTPPGQTFEVPPHSPKPEASHNGPGGYDYFQFKADAKKSGARIGLHEGFQDTSEFNPAEWGRVPVRIQEFGEPMSTFKYQQPDGKLAIAYSKALGFLLDNGEFLSSLKAHFQAWDVQAGDTWHWDVFTSMGGRANFDPQRATTHGKDFRDRIRVLRHIQELGVHFTSEGLQEGVAEFCDYAWLSKADADHKSRFAGGRTVPLLPVLFQGKTYYGVPMGPAKGLLYGGNCAYEGTTLSLDIIQEVYFSISVFWGKICNLTVRNMIETSQGWRVEYSEGGSLEVNLQTMSFVLEVDGQKYTPEHPPASPYGFTAQRINGKYEIQPAR